MIRTIALRQASRCLSILQGGALHGVKRYNGDIPNFPLTPCNC